MNPVITRYPLSFYTNLLAEGIPFSLSRWGDGEWLCLLGARGHNCDGHEYFPGLGEELRCILRRNRPYFHAIGPLALREHGGPIREWLGQELAVAPRTWHHTDVMLEASIAGELFPLVDQLRRRRVVYVGPAHLRALHERAFPLAGFVEVPLHNCYLSRAALLDQTRLLLAQEQADVVGFSAGMTANLLIDDLFDEWGQRASLIDFGSLWDVYCGVQSRSYARRSGWDALIARNLGEVGDVALVPSQDANRWSEGNG